MLLNDIDIVNGDTGWLPTLSRSNKTYRHISLALSISNMKLLLLALLAMAVGMTSADDVVRVYPENNYLYAVEHKKLRWQPANVEARKDKNKRCGIKGNLASIHSPA